MKPQFREREEHLLEPRGNSKKNFPAPISPLFTHQLQQGYKTRAQWIGLQTCERGEGGFGVCSTRSALGSYFHMHCPCPPCPACDPQASRYRLPPLLSSLEPLLLAAFAHIRYLTMYQIPQLLSHGISEVQIQIQLLAVIF